MIGINKFLFYGWNYYSVSHEWRNTPNGELHYATVPDFLANVKWTFPFEHAYSKWKACTDGNDSIAYVAKFYSELDGENRKAMLQYIIENYNDEQKLSF